jgi:hypothetical protein
VRTFHRAHVPLRAEYRRRQPEHTDLYRVIQENLRTFLALAEEADRPMPAHVEREFVEFLRCGILAEGFARVHCRECKFDRLVAFSCRGRGWCPSCLGRRMNEGAAHLTDRVFGDAPIRHWVLSLPHPLRYLLAHDANLCGEVLNAFVKSIFRWLRRRAKALLGLASVRDAHPGAVTAIQRVSGHLALNVHFHSLVTDGVFLRRRFEGPLEFVELPPPTPEEVTAIAWATCRRARRILERHGLWEDEGPGGEDALAATEPGLADLYQASVRGRIALGGSRGQRLVRFFGEAARADEEDPAIRRTGQGFNLHAAQATRAGDRAGLERLCRYILRPPMAQDRLEQLGDGRLLLRLKRAWRDGTSGVYFEPLDFLGKLVALVPPPRRHQLRFHGVYAPNARLRAKAVPEVVAEAACSHGRPAATSAPAARASRISWARLMKRVYAIDVLECPRCGSRMQTIAFVMAAEPVRKILNSMGLPADSPRIYPARPAPDYEEAA